MTAIELPALHGRNPLGLFAGLGALDIATRAMPDRRVTLRWTDQVDPVAIIQGPDSIDHLIELCELDRTRWATSPILTWSPVSAALADLKVSEDELREWLAQLAAQHAKTGDRTHIDLMAALLTEGGVAGKGDSKPTHFHFTAGQQKFLVMVRELQANVDDDRIREALLGPWRYDSSLPVLGWDSRGERIFALRGFDPAKEKKLGVPGADWLAFLGLRYFPVTVQQFRGKPQVVTTGCSPGWKSGTFTWPIWTVALTSKVVGSVLADSTLATLSSDMLRHLGIREVVRAPIRRTDQGGYGSFGPAGPAIDSPGRLSA